MIQVLVSGMVKQLLTISLIILEKLALNRAITSDSNTHFNKTKTKVSSIVVLLTDSFEILKIIPIMEIKKGGKYKIDSKSLNIIAIFVVDTLSHI